MAVLSRVVSTAAPVPLDGDASVTSAFRQVELLALDPVRTMTMAVVVMAAMVVAVVAVVRAAPLLQMSAVQAVLQLVAAEMADLTTVVAPTAAAAVMLSAAGREDVLAATALPVVIV